MQPKRASRIFAVFGLLLLASLSLAQTTLDLRGRWKGEMPKPPAAKKGEGMEEFASAMTGLMMGMMGTMKLTILGNNAYRLVYMGIPFDGHYTQTENKALFTPEKAMGLTKEELEKQKKNKPEENNNMEEMMQPTDAIIGAGGKTITFLDKEKKEGIIFKRVLPESSRKLTAKGNERPFVGLWKGVLTPPKGKTKAPGSPEEAAMAKMMAENFEMELHQDNTFDMTMMIDLKGKWSRKKGTLVLTVTEFMGMPDDGKGSKNKPLVLNISPDKASLLATNPETGEKMTFKRAAIR